MTTRRRRLLRIRNGLLAAALSFGLWRGPPLISGADAGAPVIASVSADTTGTYDTTGVTISVPSGVQVGDLLLTIMGGSATINPSTTVPTGWTVCVGRGLNSGTQRPNLGAFYRIADGTEAASYTWKGNATAGTASALGKMFRITGMRPGTYLSTLVFDGGTHEVNQQGSTGSTNSGTGTDATAECAQQVTFISNDLVFVASLIAQSGAGLSVLTATPPTGYTEQADFGQALVGTETSLTIDTAVQATPATLTTSRVITWSGTPTLGAWTQIGLTVQGDYLSPYVAASAQGTGTADATGVIVAVPSGTADGDLLVTGIAMSAVVTNTTVAPVITAPAGWTLVASIASPNSNGTTRASRLSVYSRIASSEPANYTWTGDKTSSQGATGKMYRILRASNTTTLNASATKADAATTILPTWPNITPTAPNCLLLDFISGASASTTTYVAASGSTTGRNNQDSSGGFSTDPGDASTMGIQISRAEAANTAITGGTISLVGVSSFNCYIRLSIAPPATQAASAIFAGA